MTSLEEGMMPDQFVTKVVGVSFSPEYPTNIYRIAESVANITATCSLHRDPQNKHDENAIRVDVNGTTIGHIPRLISMILASKMDSGEKWNASVNSIVVSLENAEKPGLKINVWRENNANE